MRRYLHDGANKVCAAFEQNNVKYVYVFLIFVDLLAEIDNLVNYIFFFYRNVKVSNK